MCVQYVITRLLEELLMIQPSSRERIFAAAIKLFCERGYRETTVGDIEEAAGLTRRAGGFYRHFQSKDDVLVQAVERMAGEMIADLRLDHVVALKSPRAELLVIARALLRHAEAYRPFRLFLQREGHKLPALKRAARRANARLATLDVVPWVKNVLARSGRAKAAARELGLVIFGPVLLYLVSVDRADPAFGLKDEKFLEIWADHWALWLAGDGEN
jgi:AcrR family transcriptional regulator